MLFLLNKVLAYLLYKHYEKQIIEVDISFNYKDTHKIFGFLRVKLILVGKCLLINDAGTLRYFMLDKIYNFTIK